MARFSTASRHYFFADGDLHTGHLNMSTRPSSRRPGQTSEPLTPPAINSSQPCASVCPHPTTSLEPSPTRCSWRPRQRTRHTVDHSCPQRRMAHPSRRPKPDRCVQRNARRPRLRLLRVGSKPSQLRGVHRPGTSRRSRRCRSSGTRLHPILPRFGAPPVPRGHPRARSPAPASVVHPTTLFVCGPLPGSSPTTLDCAASRHQHLQHPTLGCHDPQWLPPRQIGEVCDARAQLAPPNRHRRRRAPPHRHVKGPLPSRKTPWERIVSTRPSQRTGRCARRIRYSAAIIADTKNTGVRHHSRSTTPRRLRRPQSGASDVGYCAPPHTHRPIRRDRSGLGHPDACCPGVLECSPIALLPQPAAASPNCRSVALSVAEATSEKHPISNTRSWPLGRILELSFRPAANARGSKRSHEVGSTGVRNRPPSPRTVLRSVASPYRSIEPRVHLRPEVPA